MRTIGRRGIPGRSKGALLLLLGVGTMIGAGCSGDRCPQGEGFLDQAREGAELQGDAAYAVEALEGLVVEDSPGVYVVDTSRQEERLEQAVRAALEDPTRGGSLAAVYDDYFVQKFQRRWDEQVGVYQEARSVAVDETNRLGELARDLKGQALDVQVDEGCGELDTSPGWEVYEQWKALDRRMRGLREARADSSTDVIARVYQEWLREGGGAPAGEGPAEPPALDPVDDGVCPVGGYLFLQATRLDGHLVVVHSRQTFTCVRSDDPHAAADPELGDEPCEADAVWFTRKDPLVNEDFADGLRATVQERSDLFEDGHLETESGEVVTVDEIDLQWVTSEVSAKTPPIAVCQEEWEDPEAVAALVEEERAGLLRALGVSPDDAAYPGSLPTSETD